MIRSLELVSFSNRVEILAGDTRPTSRRRENDRTHGQGMTSQIVVAAALVQNATGELLLVRKRGTDSFMLPGGKIEPGETPLQALARELREELGTTFQSLQARFLGVFTTAAAHEPDHDVVAHLLAVNLESDANPGAEIAEMIWADILQAHSFPLAPLVTKAILPIVRTMRSAR